MTPEMTMTPAKTAVKTELPKLGVAPIRRMRLVDEAARLVRDMILTGKLTGGTWLGQVDLAEQMGISRTPLREALMKLEQISGTEAQSRSAPGSTWK